MGSFNVERLKNQEFEVMNKKELLTPTITVKEVLDRHPKVLQVFMDTGLLCVGCPAEAFHTLADVAREYNIDLNQLLQRIYRAIEDDIVQLGLSSQKRDIQNGI